MTGRKRASPGTTHSHRRTWLLYQDLLYSVAQAQHSSRGRATRMASLPPAFEPAAVAANSPAKAQMYREEHAALQVRKTPSWPRSWANFGLLELYFHRNAWANLHLLGQPNS